MMFVVKGVVNLSDNTCGELAIVSYQSTTGDHCMNFFYNREEIYCDFKVSYTNVLAKLDKRPKEILLHDVNSYIRMTEDNFELVDLSIYTKEDKEAEITTKRNVCESTCIRQNALVHSYYIPNIDQAVRSKSHMKQYQMRGISLAMKLAWENPVKYDDIDLYPVEHYYADYEAMTDIVYLDYTIMDYTQPVKSVTELVEEAMQEEEYIQDDELEDIMDQYEEEPIDDEEEYDDEDEIEMEIPNLTPRRVAKSNVIPPVVEEPKEEVKPQPTKKDNKKPNTTPQGKTFNQPRGKDGKFKKKTK